MREASMRLSHYGHTPAGLAEITRMYAETVAARLAQGFDPLRDRGNPAMQDLWVQHGRLNACRTVLEILGNV